MSRFLAPGSVNSILKKQAIKYNASRYLSAKQAFKEKLNAPNGNISNFHVGKVYHGFVCTDVQHVKDFNMIAVHLKHEKTQTEYLHLHRDDSNNVFSVNFRTTPFNSTGLPHILEHTVLCGSKKYPVRDPFFKMLNRSLATFMNAMTGPDYTFYPFSSQNEADYRNLQSIYLDAVFRPNLNHQDFLQEGWRLEHTDLSNPKSDLTFKGVVFNEMKGAFSENMSVHGQKFLTTILPDHTYGYISGGDPLEIPNLTVEELRGFHSKYYHPSNARIYSYGNFPLERNLEICNKLYLDHYKPIDPSYSRVPPQKRWTKPVETTSKCRFDKMGAPFEKQNKITVGYLLCDITDVYESFVLHLLSQLMVDGPNSPFYKSLIEPNISGGFSAMTGFDAQLRDTLFAIGLQDLEVDKFDMVKRIIDETFEKIIKEGFEKSHIESVLHGFELAIKHQHTKFGMNTLFNLVPLWNHEGPIMDAMQVSNLLNRLRDNLKNPCYLPDKVEQYFKNNNHCLTLSTIPDHHYEEKMTKMEIDLLNKKISSLDKEDRVKIFEEGLKLAEKQKEIQNLDILPCLALNDIPKALDPVALNHSSIGSIPLQICLANTNEVTYFKGILNTSDLSDDSKMLLPLLNATIDKMGTKNHSHREFDQLVHLKTGGMNFSTHIAEKIDQPTIFEEGILLSSHCLDQNAQGMFSLWSEIFEKPTYNNLDLFKMLLENYVSVLTTGIADKGHLYAMQCANGLVSSSGMLKETLSGLRHVEYMKNLVANEKPDSIMLNVSSLADKLLEGNRLRTALNLSMSNKEKVMMQFNNLCKNIPLSSEPKFNDRTFTKSEPFVSDTRCIHHVLNIPVNFCSKSIVTVPFVHPDFAKLKVLSKFLNSKYLHPIVREQNGAYGGGSKLNQDGLFNFFSYRDPNSRVTLDVFDNATKWFKEESNKCLDDQTLFEAKLGVLQQVDAPVAEFYKGIEDFLYGVSRDSLQEHRNQVLSVTKQDLGEVCLKYLSDDGARIVGKCVIGLGKNSIGEQKLERDGEKWVTVEPMNDE